MPNSNLPLWPESPAMSPNNQGVVAGSWFAAAMRSAAWATASLIALLVVGLGALLLWAGSDGSLASALQWAKSYAPTTFEHITAEGATGSLRSGGHIDRLQWQHDGLSIDAKDVTLAWQPWFLLHNTLQLDRMACASVHISDERPAPDTKSGPPDNLRLPVDIELKAFSVGTLKLSAPTVFAASGISGRYAFNGQQHALILDNAHIASGNYRGRAVLSASSPLLLDAVLSGALTTPLPNTSAPVALSFQAKVQGPLVNLLANASLQLTAEPTLLKGVRTQLPQASVTAHITAWAAQPVPLAQADFRDLNSAALWPDAPQTLLTGSASVQPLTSTADLQAAPASQAWAGQLNMTNRLPGPWDQHRLPLESLQAVGEWRSGTGLIRSLNAQTAGGQLLATGQAAVANQGQVADTAWQLQAQLKNINPQALHSQLAPLRVNGQATLRSQGKAISFDASVKASNGSGNPSAPFAAATRQLRLKDASATGSWNPALAGGTLVLSSLSVRTDDAGLTGQLEAQPAARHAKANLTLFAPGVDAKLQGELASGSGQGDMSVNSPDIAQALRWLQKLPGLPIALQSTLQGSAAVGQAELKAQWQGGWLDPTLRAQLSVPSLDWRSTPVASALNGTATTAMTAPPPVLKFRAAKAALSGPFSQMTLTGQGRLEAGQRRYTLQLTADAGRVASSERPAALAESAWRGLVRQLSVGVEDPALGQGTWQLATRGDIAAKWTPQPAGSVVEAGAGLALLSAPTTGPPATIAWQPLVWRPGELTTAGKIAGLPLAWLALVGGPALSGNAALPGSSVSGNLVFDGAWDARLADTLTLKASLARSSGDITLQSEGGQGTAGTTTRIAAGIKQARVSVDSVGDAITLAASWDTERAGKVEGQVKTRLTRLTRTPDMQAIGPSTGGWAWPPDAPLSGQVRAQLPRIGVWSALAPPGWRLRGSLAADIAIAGTRASPQLTGELQADDLALRSVVDGIELGNGRLRAQLMGERMVIKTFTLQGAGGVATGGTLTAEGEAGWADLAQGGLPTVSLSARLDRLRASLRSDRQVILSGDLQARLSGGAGKVSEFAGNLKVDQARIVLPDEGTPQLGDDVIVRNTAGVATGKKAPAKTIEPTSAQTSAKSPAAAQGNLAVKVAIALDLGQDFRVQGKGIDTLLRGQLALSGDSLVRGGDYLLEPRLAGTVNTFGGQYRAYGQRLDVEQGVLRFTGPIDNPALDILAIRPNLTQRVGVQITGTALLPRVRLYAQPDLPDAEKLSWLIVGRSSATGGAEAALLQQAAIALLGSKTGGGSSGLASALGLDELSFRGASSNADGSTTEGAVTLGKRFSRNFYAAYERSISGALGTLYIFYDLSQRFTLRAQTGQQSAIDLIFTLPYD